MTKQILRGIAITAMTCLALTGRAQDTNIDQSQYPTILQQPVDQCLAVGDSAAFSVVATNADTYQWYKNNVAMDGETNSTITISGLSTNDVGYYGATVIKGSELVPTRLALLNVYISSGTTTTTTTSALKKVSANFVSSATMMSLNDTGSGVTIYSVPVPSNGTNSTCAGAYSGFVNYLKPVSQGWGFYTDTNATVHTATDYNRTDTKVLYLGYSMDSGCNQTSVAVPNPTPSVKYRFTIYFPQGSQVPTNSYPITLDGFNP